MSIQKRKFRFLLLALIIVLAGAYFAFQNPFKKPCKPIVVTQFATINSLVEGNYDGVATIGCLKHAGDLGIGCVAPLDGELVMLDGEAYQIRFDGSVHKLEDTAKTPFSTVIRFKEARKGEVSNKANLAELLKCLDEMIPENNVPVAIRLTGKFDTVHTRSVAPQEKPYPRLAEVAKSQAEFEAQNIEGDIVAFRLPEYLAGVNVSGWHLHFLSKDKQFGGHLLGVSVAKAEVSVCLANEFKIVLPPKGHDFYKTDLSKVKKGELTSIETAK